MGEEVPETFDYHRALSRFAPDLLEKKAEIKPAPTRSRTHIIKRGDTLWEIARTYKINVEKLKKANNLTSDSRLMPDQELIIPN